MNIHEKILTLDTLEQTLNNLRHVKTIVQCHGVFDLLHIGHIRHFKKAKTMGDILIVSVTPDRYVNKGPGRPVFPEKLRAEAIAALDFTDYVVINEWPTAVEIIGRIKPNIYVKGSEYREKVNDITGKITDEENAVKAVGGSISFTDDITFSSSNLINRYFPSFSDEVVDYLNRLKKKNSVDQILGYLESSSKLKVLVIGEAIIDQYNFCETIGKSGKEPILAVKHLKSEKYAGGSLAITNHVANFCKEVTCVTYLGEHKEYEPFILERLKENVKLEPIYKCSSPTILKKRYIEEYTNQKLFEVYEINDEPLSGNLQKIFLNKIKELAPKFDLVIIGDYGHGLISEETTETIVSSAKFLSVNTQANAGNHGFNCIAKYPTADYVCIAHRELELTFRERNKPPEDHIKQLVRNFNYKNIVVTSGNKGSLTYRQGEEIVKVPAFSYQVKDRVGAGDSVLALTSLCMVQNAPIEIVGFIGNVVGAEAVAIMGNERYIEKVALMKHISHLLK